MGNCLSCCSSKRSFNPRQEAYDLPGYRAPVNTPAQESFPPSQQGQDITPPDITPPQRSATRCGLRPNTTKQTNTATLAQDFDFNLGPSSSSSSRSSSNHLAESMRNTWHNYQEPPRPDLAFENGRPGSRMGSLETSNHYADGLSTTAGSAPSPNWNDPTIGRDGQQLRSAFSSDSSCGGGATVPDGHANGINGGSNTSLGGDATMPAGVSGANLPRRVWTEQEWREYFRQVAADRKEVQGGEANGGVSGLTGNGTTIRQVTTNGNGVHERKEAESNGSGDSEVTLGATERFYGSVRGRPSIPPRSPQRGGGRGYVNGGAIGAGHGGLNGYVNGAGH